MSPITILSLLILILAACVLRLYYLHAKNSKGIRQRARANEITEWCLKRLQHGELRQKEFTKSIMKKFALDRYEAEELLASLTFKVNRVHLEIKEGYVWLSLGSMNKLAGDTFLLRVMTEKPIIY